MDARSKEVQWGRQVAPREDTVEEVEGCMVDDTHHKGHSKVFRTRLH